MDDCCPFTLIYIIHPPPPYSILLAPNQESVPGLSAATQTCWGGGVKGRYTGRYSGG